MNTGHIGSETYTPRLSPIYGCQNDTFHTLVSLPLDSLYYFYYLLICNKPCGNNKGVMIRLVYYGGGGGGADAKHRWHQNLTYQGATCPYSSSLFACDSLIESICTIPRPLRPPVLPDHCRPASLPPPSAGRTPVRVWVVGCRNMEWYLLLVVCGSNRRTNVLL